MGKNLPDNNKWLIKRLIIQAKLWHYTSKDSVQSIMGTMKMLLTNLANVPFMTLLLHVKP